MSEPTVLLVDDDEPIHTAMEYMFTGRGVKMLHAYSADQALELVDHADVVISDIVMPEKDGQELLWEVKKRGKTPKIVTLSGFSFPGTEETTKALGALRHFRKPLDMEEVRDFVLELLGLGG